MSHRMLAIALLAVSLSFIAYYLVASFILHARAALKLRSYRREA